MLLPFSTSMNVMAFGEYEYETEQDYRYAMNMVNDYEDENRSYDNDYEPDYSSYRHNYKPDYQSYENDNYKKSKDKSYSISINKLNCNNVNNNINGDVIGNVNVGNNGREGEAANSSSEGSFSANAFGSGERYYDGDNKKDKGFTCITNNNNNNTIIMSGGGNATNNGNETIIDSCEECFNENLNDEQLQDIEDALTGFGINLQSYCETLAGTTLSNDDKLSSLNGLFEDVEIPGDLRPVILECLDELGIIDFFSDSGLSDLPTTTGSAGGLTNLPSVPSLGLP